MVKLPRVEQTVPYRVAEMPHSTGDGYAAPGRAIQGLGSAIASLGGAFDAMGSEQRKDDEHLDTLTALESSNSLRQRMIVARQEAENGDGTVALPDGSKVPFTQYGASIVEDHHRTYTPRFRTNAGRRTFAIQAERERGQYNSSNLEFEYGRKKAAVFSATQATITTQASVLDEVFTGLYEKNEAGGPVMDENGIPLPMSDESRTKMEASIASGVAVMGGVINSYKGPIERKQALWASAAKVIEQKITEGIRNPADLKKAWAAAEKAVGLQINAMPEMSAPEMVQGNLGPMTGANKKLPTDHPNWPTFDPSKPRTLSSLVKIKPALTSGSRDMTIDGLTQPMTAQLGAMFADMPPNLRSAIMIDEAHRSWEYQARLRAKHERGEMGPAARPGQSRHNHGEAVDIAPVGGWEAKTPEYKQALNWIYQNGGRYGIKNPNSLRIDDPAHFQFAGRVNLGGPAVANAGNAIRGNLTAYSPQAGGSAMQGGYSSARPGPDGKREVRTLEDVASGKSDYITIAGANPDGRSYVIPEITFVGKDGKERTLKNVKAVVHDTGSAFKDAPEGRFDIPVGRDIGRDIRNKNHAIWKKTNVAFIPEGKRGQTPDTPAQTTVSLKGLTDAQKAAKLDELGKQGYRNFSYRYDDNERLIAKKADKFAWGPTGAGPEGGGADVSDAKQFSGPGWAKEPIGKFQRGEYDTKEGPVRVADASGSTVPLAKPGVATELLENMVKRRPAIERAHLNYVKGLVDSFSKSAEEGDLHPQASLVEKMVRESGDPQLVQRFRVAAFDLATMQEQSTKTPAEVREFAKRFEARFGGKVSPEQREQINRYFKLADNIDKNLDEDAITWSERKGVIPPQPDISVENVTLEQLSMRAMAGREIQRKYNLKHPIFFRTTEREALEKVLLEGGERAMIMLGSLHKAFGKDTPFAIAEFAKKNPELTLAAWHVMNQTNPQVAKDLIAHAQAKADPNYKPSISVPRQTAQVAMDNVVGTKLNLAGNPAIERDRVLNAALAIMEFRRATSGKAAAAAADLEPIIKEVLGERTIGGQVYGGVAPTMFGFGDKTPIPPNWSQKNWREALSYATVRDLFETGHSTPVDAAGRPIFTYSGKPEMTAAPTQEKSMMPHEVLKRGIESLTGGGPEDLSKNFEPVVPAKDRVTLNKILNGKFHLIDDGKYVVEIDGEFVKSIDNLPESPDQPPQIKTFVIDLKALEARLRAKNKTLFAPIGGK